MRGARRRRAQATGLRFCFYYSIMDWHHRDCAGAPAYPDDNRRSIRSRIPNFARYVETYMKPQLQGAGREV